jgi:hypothetical protein
MILLEISLLLDASYVVHLYIKSMHLRSVGMFLPQELHFSFCDIMNICAENFMGKTLL